MRKGPRKHNSPTSPGGHGAPSSGRTTCASNPGTGRPKEPRRCSGCSHSSSLARQTLPASVIPSMAWCSSGSAGRDARRHDGVQVAAPDGGRSRDGERRVLGHVGDRGREPVDHGWALALEHVEDTGGRSVRSHRPGWPPPPSSRAMRRRSRRSRRRASSRRGSRGVVAAQLVQVVQMPDRACRGCGSRPSARWWNPRCGRSPSDRPA